MAADDMIVAIRALAWTLSDDNRAQRLLDLTGLDSGALRTRAGDPEVLGAVMAFLASHEPDLIACADALDLPVAALAMVGQRLSGEDFDR